MYKEIKEDYNNLQTYINRDFDEKYYNRKAKNKLRDFISYLPSDKEADILDLGCGQGFFCYALQKEGYVNFLGVDDSEDQVQLFKKFVNKDKVVKQDIFQFFETNKKKFSVISFFDVLEHLEKESALKLLKTMRENLTEDGRLLIKTPNMNSPNMNIYFDVTHIWGYNEFSLRAILMAAGFSTIKVNASKNRFFINTILQKIISIFITVVDLIYERTNRIHIHTSNLMAVAYK